jgi:hypothetical protein
MRQSSVLQQAARTRARLQRIRDLKLFDAKAMFIDEKYCQLQVSGAKEKFIMEDQFMVEVHGPKHKIIVTGIAVGIEDSSLRLRLNDNMKVLPQSEQARFTKKNFTCSIVLADGEKITGTVDDISEGGIGIILPDEVKVGTNISILVKYRTQVAQVTGLVKYCREYNDGIGSLRIGCSLQPLERIDSNVWQAWCDMVQDLAA